MGKRALVISGGGAKGAYAVGALKHIVNTLGITFDLAAGTSTGGLIVPLVLLGEMDTLEHVYSNVETKDILKPKRYLFNALAKATALNSVEPLAKQIRKAVTQERVDKLLAMSNKELFITTVNIQSQRTVYFHTSDTAKTSNPEAQLIRMRDRESMLRAILATACIPFFMPAIDIPGGSDQQYLDGGVRDVTPVQIAIDNGATEIYCIVMTPVKKKVDQVRYKTAVDILQRTTDLFSSEVMLNDIQQANRHSEDTMYVEALRKKVQARFNLSDQELDDLFTINDPTLPNPNPFADRPGVKIITIRPETGDDVPGKTLDFNPTRMRKMIKAGHKKAVEVLGPGERQPV